MRKTDVSELFRPLVSAIMLAGGAVMAASVPFLLWALAIAIAG